MRHKIIVNIINIFKHYFIGNVAIIYTTLMKNDQNHITVLVIGTCLFICQGTRTGDSEETFSVFAFKSRSHTMKSLKALQSLQEKRSLPNVIEAFQCSMTCIIKYTSAFAQLSMSPLCVIAALT